ncbi:diguanylate cyclase [Lelliottia sp. SL45]|uniref:GGDEF domain-containing protein n=1 Tax=Lelliottia sp. SL45 TaxID=2994665 RepID=UPI002274CD62|nr:sensor domain-containing diguanylate cyclase [Lelliottia sp. SL45]MCY1700962.1 diguanylate cyclase [Lelliottia sp. SL45]
MLNNEANVMLKSESEILSFIFDNAPVGMALVSPEGRWEKVSDSLVNMLGYDKDYLLSVNFQDITHPDDISDSLQKMAYSCGNRSSYQLEKRYRLASGGYIWALLNVSMIFSNEGKIKYYIAQIHDIDKLKKRELELFTQKQTLHELNQALEKLATVDSLTGIANRRKFMEWFEEAISRARCYSTVFSLALVDIDLFKSYNDEYGHYEGDVALKVLASEMKRSLRKNDRIARFGGEEFIILLTDTDEKNSFHACERVRVNIEGLTCLKRKFTVSIGLVTFTPAESGGVSFSDLYRFSDNLLYEAKKSGRNMIKGSAFNFA